MAGEPRQRATRADEDAPARAAAERAPTDAPQRLLDAIGESAFDLIVEIGPAGLLWASPNHAKVLGRSPEELLGTDPIDLVHPDERERVREAIRGGLRGGPAWLVEYRYRHSGGRWRRLESSGRAFRTAEGERRLVVISRDVTERARTHEALQRSRRDGRSRRESLAALHGVAEAVAGCLDPASLLERSARALLEHTRFEGVAFHELDGEAGALRLLAAPALAEPLPEALGTLPLEGSLPGAAARRRELVASGPPEAEKAFPPELRDRLRAEGFRAAAAVPLVADDAVLGTALLLAREARELTALERETLTDVGRTVGAGFANVRHVARLEREMRERAELEAQVQHAQRLETVGRLAGGVAHDFNNLLTVVSGHAELLEAELGGSERARRSLEEILRATDRATALTRQLLAFSRRQAAAPGPVDLNAVVRAMEPLLRRLLGESVELHVALEPELGAVRADAGQMEQVLVNLAANAREAMPEGGRLEVRTCEVAVGEGETRARPGTARGRWIRLTVADDGRGMDPETQASMFDPFFTTKEVGAGSGLGLAVVHGIVRQSGGRLWAESAPGKGTQVGIDLPPDAGGGAPAAGGALRAFDGTRG